MKRKTTRKSKKNENSFVQELLLQILKTIPQSMMSALLIGGVIIALIVGAYFLLRNSNVSIGNEATVKLSPTTIEQMEAIGQWEFLAISDEEIADTVRKGIFSDGKQRQDSFPHRAPQQADSRRVRRFFGEADSFKFADKRIDGDKTSSR